MSRVSNVNYTVADGAGSKPTPSKAEPPAGSGAGQEGHGSPRPTSTYHSREDEALGAGGRFSAETPRVDWHGQPTATWSEDPTGVEPPIPGDGLEWGRPIDE
jgi:hypothetical protein